MRTFRFGALGGLLRPALFAAALLGGCADSAGRDCDSNADCDDDQICAPVVAGCASLRDCPGICGEPCLDDRDCDDGFNCESATGSADSICREPNDPGED